MLFMGNLERRDEIGAVGLLILTTLQAVVMLERVSRDLLLIGGDNPPDSDGA